MNIVTSREGRVSRNINLFTPVIKAIVTSREGRVSRNPLRRPRISLRCQSRPARGV